MSLKIALIARPHLPVCLPTVGGMSNFTYLWAEGLARRGHKVTVFAGKNSKLPPDVKLVPAEVVEAEINTYQAGEKFYRQAERETHTRRDIVNISFGEMSRRFDYKIDYYLQAFSSVVAEGFDLVHLISYEAIGLYPAMFVSVPAVISLHGHHRYYGPDQHLFLQHVKKIPGRHPVAFVSVSRFIQQVYDQFFTSQVIYNGVNFSPYRLQTKKEAYCAFLGRIEPLKGLDFAIDFCERNKILLKIAGGINDEYYFEHQVRPHLDGGLVEYVGPLDERQKNIFLGKARCLLMPTRYEEAFGRVIVEAMACGTPVIAFNKGAVGEIIKHGKTGFLIEEDDFAACLDCFERLSTIDSDLCRKAVEAKFSIERMLDEYEALYKSITI